MSNQKLWTRNFLNISLSSFFLFLTFYYLLVTLPIYTLNSLHAHEAEAGLIVTVFLIAAIVIRPITGRWIERFGERAVLLCSLIIFFSSSTLYIFSHSMFSLLTLRFFHGIGFGMATTAAGAIVASIIPETRRGEGMGYYVMSMNLAMVFGPFLGLLAMQKWGINIMFAISTFSALCALVSGLFIHLPAGSPAQNKLSSPLNNRLSVRNLFEMSALPISLVGALFALVYSSIISFVSVYAKELGLTAVSSYFFVVYALALLISRPFTGRWFDRFGANAIVYPAILCFAAGMVLLGETNTAAIFLFSAALIGLGWGTLFPSFQTIAIQSVVPSRRGLATATFLSIFDTGIAVGSLVVGVVGSKIGFSSLYLYSSLVVLIGCGVYYSLHGRISSLPVKQKHRQA